MQNPKLPNATNSAEIVASIGDVLTQILVKVPIKPLFRSKLVCKHWLSLISSHHFCVRRNPTPIPAQGFFLIVNNCQHEYVPLFPNNLDSFIPSINLNFTTAPCCSKPLHSCNGLLLCCTFIIRIDVGLVLHQSFYVYNPTTNFSTALPYLPDSPSCTDRYPMCATLAFDPIKSPHYKVVLVVVINSAIGKTCEIQIYSSETRCWIYGCEIGMERLDDVVRGNGVYWNDSVHWLNNKLSTRNPINSILFHVDTLMLGEMPSPPVVHDTPPVVYDNYWLNNIYFGESG